MIATLRWFLLLFLLGAFVLSGCPRPGGNDDDDAGDDDDGDDDDTSGRQVWCWTLTQAQQSLAVLEIDMASGDWFEYGRFGSGITQGFHSSYGMVRVGDTLVTAIRDEGGNYIQAEIDLGADTISYGGESWSWLAVHGTDLVSLCEGDQAMCVYEDFAAWCAGTTSDVVWGSFVGSRIGIADDEAFIGWHSTDQIDVHSYTDGTYQTTVHPEGYDDWIHGISVVGNQMILMKDDDIFRFDRETGAQLGQVSLEGVAPGWGPSGLWCEIK